jgi:DNA-binding transcriptional regulator YiaG
MNATWKDSKSKAHNDQCDVKTLATYEPNIGAPFKVILENAVKQTFSHEGKLLDTCIPNMGGLLKEVALARSLIPRKFTPAEIKFVRKAVGLKATELADLLGISAEHLSRCENGDRALSISAEKLLRVIVLKKRYRYSEMTDRLSTILNSKKLDADKMERTREIVGEYNEAIAELEKAIFDSRIQTVYPADSELCFRIRLRPRIKNKPSCSGEGAEEDDWRRAA